MKTISVTILTPTIFDCEEQDGLVFIYISDDGEAWYSYDDEEYEIWE